MGYLCGFLYSFSMCWKLSQVLPFELGIFHFTTTGGLLCPIVSFTIYMSSFALAIPLLNKFGTAGALFLNFAGQLLSATPLRLMDGEFLLERSTLPFSVAAFVFIFTVVVGFGNGTIWFLVVKVDSHLAYLAGMCVATAGVFVTYAGLLLLAWHVEFLRGWPAVLVLTNVIAALINVVFRSSLVPAVYTSPGRGDSALESGRIAKVEAKLDGAPNAEQTSC